MIKPYVFISYSRQDREFVEKLSAALRVEGVQTWSDVENIAAGQNWQVQTERALLQAQVLLYVASRNTSASMWMAQELAAFMDGSERVIPVIIDDEGLLKLPPLVRQFQWADFRVDFNAALQILLEGLGSLQESRPVTPTEAKSKGYAFISYASEDADFVTELKSYMGGRGYAYWDFKENDRNYQVDHTLELEDVINRAEVTLSVVSPDWKKSRTSMKELHFSEETHTPIFFLRVRDPGPTLALSGMTFIDFTGQWHAGFQKMDVELKKYGL